MTISEAVQEDSKSKKKIAVTVNKKPVTLDGNHQTGASIKAAAIAQGVAIQPDFLLSRKNNKKFKPIADHQKVDVKEGDEFNAVDGDDNS